MLGQQQSGTKFGVRPQKRRLVGARSICAIGLIRLLLSAILLDRAAIYSLLQPSNCRVRASEQQRSRQQERRTEWKWPGMREREREKHALQHQPHSINMQMAVGHVEESRASRPRRRHRAHARKSNEIEKKKQNFE